MKFDTRFMELARLVSSWSKDPNTKVGCVIVSGRRVVSTGYNGFPSLVPDLSELLNDRPTKNKLTIHAEINAILNAAKNGVSTNGCTIFTTFFPCTDCLKSIMNAGIIRVVSPPFSSEASTNQKWADDYETSQLILDLANSKRFVNEDGYFEVILEGL